VAFEPGNLQVFKLDNSAGSLVDLSTYINSVGYPREVNALETTTLGKTAKTYIVGLSDGTVSIGGPWDATLDAHMAGILGLAASKTYEFGPQGSTAAEIKYTGECYLTSYEISGEVDGVVEWSGELQLTDTQTRGTW
jgi:hypothetical protein